MWAAPAPRPCGRAGGGTSASPRPAPTLSASGALRQRHLDAGEQVVVQAVQRVAKAAEARAHHRHRARRVPAQVRLRRARLPGICPLGCWRPRYVRLILPAEHWSGSQRPLVTAPSRALLWPGAWCAAPDECGSVQRRRTCSMCSRASASAGSTRGRCGASLLQAACEARCTLRPCHAGRPRTAACLPRFHAATHACTIISSLCPCSASRSRTSCQGPPHPCTAPGKQLHAITRPIALYLMCHPDRRADLFGG
jgi:hypothetical protein